MLSKLEWQQKMLANAAGVSQGHVSEAVNGIAELGEKLEAFLDFLEETGRIQSAEDIKRSHKEFMKHKIYTAVGGVPSPVSDETGG